jgi:hypothetical protein
MDKPRVYFQEDAYSENCESESKAARKPYGPVSGIGTTRPCETGRVDIGFFTMVPRHFFGSGIAAALGVNASFLYVALCEHANRNRSNTFKASDKALASDTNLAPRTICDLRKELVEKGLVTCTREPGQSFFYTILPQAFEWKAVKLRPRAKRKPRGYAALRKPFTADESTSSRVPPYARFATGCSKVC